MSTAVERQAEIIKIARALNLTPDDVPYLRDLETSELARLREQITDTLFAGSADRFKLLATASRLVPTPISATIAQRALGPLLSAQMAGLVEPSRAVDLARQLKPDFLADVATYLDPRRAAPVISRIPADLVGAVAEVLSRRGDYVTMGRFVSYLEPTVISATFSRIPDAAMLQTAFVMEGKERLDAIVALLPETRIPDLMIAAREDDLWAEILSLIGYLAPATQSRLADMAAADDATLQGLTAAAERLQAWDAVLPIVPRMSPENQVRTAALTAQLRDDSLQRIIATVDTRNLWSMFVPMVAAAMDTGGREHVAALLAEEPDAVIDHLADAVEADNLWADLLAIAAEMREEALHRIADRLLGTAIEQRLNSVLAAAAANDLWQEGLTLIARLSPALKGRLAPVAAQLDPARATEVLSIAEGLGLVDGLGPISGALRAIAAD